MLVIENGFIVSNLSIRKWLHSSYLFYKLHKVIGKHICTNLNSTKYHKSFLVNYLKLTLQDLIKNSKETNIANVLKVSNRHP